MKVEASKDFPIFEESFEEKKVLSRDTTTKETCVIIFNTTKKVIIQKNSTYPGGVIFVDGSVSEELKTFLSHHRLLPLSDEQKNIIYEGLREPNEDGPMEYETKYNSPTPMLLPTKGEELPPDLMLSESFLR